MLDFGSEQFWTARAYRSQEVGHVNRFAAGTALMFLLRLILAVKHFEVAVRIECERPVGAVERHKLISMSIAAQALPAYRLSAGEFVTDGLGIGSLLVVCKGVASATGYHPLRRDDIQSPAAQIKGVNAIVSQFAVTPMPTPMPIVMDQIVDVVSMRRWPLPKIVVKRGGNLGKLSFSNGSAGTTVDGLRQIDFADRASV